MDQTTIKVHKFLNSNVLFAIHTQGDAYTTRLQSNIGPIREDIVGGALEDIGCLLGGDEPANIGDPRLILDEDESVEVLGERDESGVLQEGGAAGGVLWDFEVVAGVRLEEVVLSGDHDGVALVVVGEAGIEAGEVFADLNGRVRRVVAVEGAVGGQDEEQVAVVAREVLVTEVVGEVVAEIGPHRHVEVLLEREEEVVEQLGLPLAHAHSQLLVGVGVLHGDVLQARVHGGLGVVEVEEDVVDLQHHQEFLALQRHLNYYNRC